MARQPSMCWCLAQAPAAPSSTPPIPSVVSQQILRCRLQDGQAAQHPLVLVAEYPLAGMVEGLAALKTRFAGLQRDALLLTFRHAALVLYVSWHWPAAGHRMVP